MTTNSHLPQHKQLHITLIPFGLQKISIFSIRIDYFGFVLVNKGIVLVVQLMYKSHLKGQCVVYEAVQASITITPSGKQTY